MAAGYHNWAAGERVTAANLEDYCQLQTVMRFANAAARDSALTDVLTEGLAAYLIDTNSLTVYSGSAWSTVGPVHGAGISWTPTWTQTATITKTVDHSTYHRVGRKISARFRLDATSAGTGGGTILFTLPVTASTSSELIGTVGILNASDGSKYQMGWAFTASTTTFGMITQGNPAALATTISNSEAIASGDLAWAQIEYEAAGDA